MSRDPKTDAALPPAPPAAAKIDPPAYRLPDDSTLRHAARLSIVEDKPIVMDYWTSSLAKTSLIGVTDSQEKILVKDAEQYTSPIAQIFKNGRDFIIKTENSIYIVDREIPTKRISM